MDLREVDVRRRHACLRVGVLGRPHGRVEADEGVAGLVARLPTHDREADAEPPHGGVRELLGAVGPADDHGRRAVGGRTTVGRAAPSREGAVLSDEVIVADPN